LPSHLIRSVCSLFLSVFVLRSLFFIFLFPSF
jgi:hypothetical protein